MGASECQEQGTGTHTPRLPAPPEPENDKGIFPPSIKSPSLEGLEGITPENVDIFKLDAVAALKLLCRSIDSLVQMTGDVPPTPPARSRGASPVRGGSKLRETTTADATTTMETPRKENMALRTGLHPQQQQEQQQEHIDGVSIVNTHIGSPEAQAHEPTTVEQIVGAHAQPVYMQHGALARKFYSKRPPPISIEDYLMRMHKYCPTSTAVYLASSLYITRLAVQEQILPVTPRNVHRLLLACLRVAMKALEDLSWPHGRVSKVGGVSEVELGRLEITFCYLTDFNLKVDAAMLQREAENLCRHNRFDHAVLLDSPLSPMDRRLPEEVDRKARTAEKRKASSTLGGRPVVQVGTGIEVMGQS
ncbi:hypothetical protein A1O1_05340 [Capronia coronata CBS 617.96]|uniref:Uncharacterized protein n=1 Tax=Capronia coronata CBS 617.96 TaxID=1182541 RepID=W9YFI5_9EURO|nr:uncharacterized protein A1O1_05340 [Capronia coronata CBS 617.96]EXJ88410.1 hypothetical protein A1O1_05340 [Capronia coronata CBS 617.96]